MNTRWHAAAAREERWHSRPTPRWGRKDWGAVAILGCLSFMVVTLFGQAYATLSPIDELQHIDYAIKISQFEAVNKNELVGQDALHEAACRSVDAPGYAGPPCDLSVTHVPDNFQERGVNTAASANPPYYFVSGVIGRVAVAVTPIDSLVRGIRLSGVFWMTLGLSLMWALLGELQIPRSQRAVAIGLITATPLLAFGYSTINPDNAILAISSAVLLMVLRFERERSGLLATALVCLAAVITEPTSVLAVAAGGTHLMLRSRSSGPFDPRLGLVGGGLILTVAPVLTLASRVRVFLLPPLPDLTFDLPRDVVHAAGPDYVTTDLLLSRLNTLINPIGQPYVPEFLRSQLGTSILTFTGMILVGSMLAAILTSPADRPIGSLATSSFIWLLVAGPLFTMRWSGSTLPIPARYGLPLVPVLVASVASVAYKTPAKISLSGLAALSNGYLFLRLASEI